MPRVSLALSLLTLVGQVLLTSTEVADKLMLSAFGTLAFYLWFCKTQEIPESEIIKKREKSMWV